MLFFSYRASDASGKVVRGVLPAANESELQARLSAMGLQLLRAKPTRARAGFARSIPRGEMIQFCMHMEQCMTSGIGAIDSLNDFIEDAQSRRFKTALIVIVEAIKGGQSMSRAMEAYPKMFDDVFRGLIRAGEASGTLPQCFLRLARDLRWQDEMRAKVKKALMYPVFTFIVISAVTVFLLTYLVPQLADFIRSMNQQLTWNTRLLLSTSQLLVHHGGKIAAGIGALALVTFLAIGYAPFSVRLQIDRIMLRTPLVGEIVQKAALARYASVLAMLYSAGIPVLDALSTAGATLGNRWLTLASENVMRRLREGAALSVAFEETRAFPKLVVRSIRIGENTGRIDSSLGNVTYFFEREVNEKLERMQTLIEPIMTVALGIILGWLMISVLGPVYDLIGKIRT